MPYPETTDPDYCPGSRQKIANYDHDKIWFRCPSCDRLISSMGKQQRFFPHLKNRKRARKRDSIQEGLTSFGLNSRERLREPMTYAEPEEERLMELGVYVPIEGTKTTILPGSAIVGRRAEGGYLVLDYEGNVYGHMPDWETMAFHAADRHLVRYPTIARIHVDPAGWLQVGWFDHETRTLDIENHAALDAWRDHGQFAANSRRAELVEVWEETK